MNHQSSSLVFDVDKESDISPKKIEAMDEENRQMETRVLQLVNSMRRQLSISPQKSLGVRNSIRGYVQEINKALERSIKVQKMTKSLLIKSQLKRSTLKLELEKQRQVSEMLRKEVGDRLERDEILVSYESTIKQLKNDLEQIPILRKSIEEYKILIDKLQQGSVTQEAQKNQLMKKNTQVEERVRQMESMLEQLREENKGVNIVSQEGRGRGQVKGRGQSLSVSRQENLKRKMKELLQTILKRRYLFENEYNLSHKEGKQRVCQTLEEYIESTYQVFDYYCSCIQAVYTRLVRQRMQAIGNLATIKVKYEQITFNGYSHKKPQNHTTSSQHTNTDNDWQLLLRKQLQKSHRNYTQQCGVNTSQQLAQHNVEKSSQLGEGKALIKQLSQDDLQPPKGQSQGLSIKSREQKTYQENRKKDVEIKYLSDQLQSLGLKYSGIVYSQKQLLQIIMRQCNHSISIQPPDQVNAQYIGRILRQTFKALRSQGKHSFDKLNQQLQQYKMKLDYMQEENRRLQAKLAKNEKSISGIEYIVQNYKAIKGTVSEDTVLKLLKQNSLQSAMAELHLITKQICSLVEQNLRLRQTLSKITQSQILWEYLDPNNQAVHQAVEQVQVSKQAPPTYSQSQIQLRTLPTQDGARCKIF